MCKDDSDVNENGKKVIGLDWQNNNSARALRIFVYFVPVTARLRRENAFFYVLPRTQDDDFLFLFLNFDTVFYNSTPEKDSCQHSTNWTKGNKRDKVWRSATSLFVSSAKHRHYEKTLKSSGKCFIYGKLLRHTNKVSLRFLLRDTLHEAFFTGYQEGNIIDNHS